jgi:hypothetical protein
MSSGLFTRDRHGNGGNDLTLMYGGSVLETLETLGPEDRASALIRHSVPHPLRKS